MESALASSEFIYFTTIAAVIACNTASVGIGQGITCKAALEASNEQPAAHNVISRTALFGMALIETTAIIGTIVSLLLLINAVHTARNMYAGIASIAIGIAICIPGLLLGVVSAFPARAACQSVARQPFLEQRFSRFMLVMVSLLQTPIIFGLIIILAQQSQLQITVTIRDMLRLIASGICFGIGSIGPSLGLAIFTTKALESLGRFKHSQNALTSFIFISQAIIETPAIFSLIGSLLLLLVVPPSPTENIIEGISFLCASLVLGLGTLGAGISSGKVAAAACEQIAYKPELVGLMSRTSMFGQGIIETSVIYTFLFALVFIFRNPG